MRLGIVRPDLEFKQPEYYCARCLAVKPFLHKHDHTPVVVLRWIASGLTRLRPGAKGLPLSRF